MAVQIQNGSAAPACARTLHLVLWFVVIILVCADLRFHVHMDTLEKRWILKELL